MAEKILMPALSPTMTKGNLAKWLKKEGELVAAGDIIAEIETDKAIMEIEAIDDGIIAKILVSAGTKNVKVNELIAIIAEEGESIQDAIMIIHNEINKKLNISKEVRNITETQEKKKEVENKNQESNRLFISPIAKRIAKQNNINTKEIIGSGPKGRIIKLDVQNTIKKQIDKNTIYQDTQSNNIRIPITNIRKIIAERLVKSKQQVPHFYLNIECVVDQLLDIRESINSSNTLDINHEHYFKISINDILIKISALTLLKNPQVNSAWDENEIIQFKNIDVAIAVSINDGVITPIVRNADKKSLVQISNETKDLIKKSRSQTLKSEEYQGGGFSISNLGMYNIKSFYAIINPPQSSILSIGSIRTIPMYNKNDDLEKKQVMSITLSCDHRVIDGRNAAMFLNTFKQLVENPSLMLCY